MGRSPCPLPETKIKIKFLNYMLKARMSDETQLDVIRCIAVFRFLMMPAARDYDNIDEETRTKKAWGRLAGNDYIPSGIKLHIFCELCNVLGIKPQCQNFSELLLAILHYLIDIAVKTNALTVDVDKSKNMKRWFPKENSAIRIDKDFALETLKFRDMRTFQYRCLLIRAMVHKNKDTFCTRALFMVLEHANQTMKWYQSTFNIHDHMMETTYTQEQFNGTTVVRGDISISDGREEEEKSRERHAITPKVILKKPSDTLRRSAFNQEKYPNYVRLTEVVRDFYFPTTHSLPTVPLPPTSAPAENSCTLHYFKEHAIDGVAHCLGGLALINLSSKLKTLTYDEFHQSHMNFDVPEFFTGQKAPLGILLPYFIVQQEYSGRGTIYKYVFENASGPPGQTITFMSVFNLKLDKTFQKPYNRDIVKFEIVQNEYTATTPDSPTERIKHFFDMKYVVDKDYTNLPTMWTYEVQSDAVVALQNQFKRMKNVIRQLVVAQRQPIRHIRKAFDDIELHGNASIHKGIERYIRHPNPFFDSIGFVLPHKVLITSAKDHEKHNKYYEWYQRSCELDLKKNSKEHRQTLVDNELPPEFLQEVTNNIKTAIIEEVHRCTILINEFKQTHTDGIRSFFENVETTREIKKEIMEQLEQYQGEPIKAAINLSKSLPRCDSDRPYTYQYKQLIHNTCVFMFGRAACGESPKCLYKSDGTHNTALDQLEKKLAERYTKKDGLKETVANLFNNYNPWYKTSAPEHLTAAPGEISLFMSYLRRLSDEQKIISPVDFCRSFPSMEANGDAAIVFQYFDILTTSLLHYAQNEAERVIQMGPNLNWESIAKDVFMKSNEPSLVWAEWNWIVYERAKRIFDVAEEMQREFQEHCMQIHKYGFMDIYEYLCMKAYKSLSQNERDRGQWHLSKRMSKTELARIKKQLEDIPIYLAGGVPDVDESGGRGLAGQVLGSGTKWLEALTNRIWASKPADETRLDPAFTPALDIINRALQDHHRQRLREENTFDSSRASASDSLPLRATSSDPSLLRATSSDSSPVPQPPADSLPLRATSSDSSPQQLQADSSLVQQPQVRQRQASRSQPPADSSPLRATSDSSQQPRASTSQPQVRQPPADSSPLRATSDSSQQPRASTSQPQVRQPHVQQPQASARQPVTATRTPTRTPTRTATRTPATPNITGMTEENADLVHEMFRALNTLLNANDRAEADRNTTLYGQMSAMTNLFLENDECAHNRTETMRMVPDIRKEHYKTDLIDMIVGAVDAHYAGEKNSKSVEIFYDPPKSVVQVRKNYYDVHNAMREFDTTLEKDPGTIYNEQEEIFEKLIVSARNLDTRIQVEYFVNMCLAYGMKMMPSGCRPKAFIYNFKTQAFSTAKDENAFTIYMTMKTLANVVFWPNYHDTATATVNNHTGDSPRALKATRTFYSRHEFQELRKSLRFSGLKDPVESVLYILQALEAEKYCHDLNESVLQESAQRVMSDIDNYLQKTKELLNPIPTADALTLCVQYQAIYEKGDQIENALLSIACAQKRDEKNEEVNKKMVKKLTKEHYGSMCKRLIKWLPNAKHQTYITFDEGKHELFCIEHKGEAVLYDKHEKTLSHVLVFVDLKLPDTVFLMLGRKCANQETILQKKDFHYTISPMLYALITKPIFEQTCEKIKMQKAYRTADIEVALQALQSFPPLPELLPLECDSCAQIEQIDEPEIRNVTKPQEASLRPPLFPIA